MWTGWKSRDGYGIKAYHSKRIKAHRLAWILTYGPIPKGLFICHHCDNPACINPNHLFIGTNYDNVKDAMNKGRKRGGHKNLGEDNGQSKMTVEKIKKMRKLYGKFSAQKLSEMFGISQSQINDIKRGKFWNWVK
jgi:hypothetical protein